MKNYYEKAKKEWPKNFNNSNKVERDIPAVYPVIDTDLARDNIENDLTSADLQDLENRMTKK